MALFNQPKNEPVEINSEIAQADAKCKEAQNNLSAAFYELGKKYFEDQKDSDNNEYISQISEIKNLIEKEVLCTQYRLSFEGKMRCESCKAIITSDSAFCNKCGTPITPWDFSSIVGAPQSEPKVIQEAEPAPKQNVCPKCGASTVPGAAFCEKCGQAL